MTLNLASPIARGLVAALSEDRREHGLETLFDVGRVLRAPRHLAEEAADLRAESLVRALARREGVQHALHLVPKHLDARVVPGGAQQRSDHLLELAAQAPALVGGACGIGFEASDAVGVGHDLVAEGVARGLPASRAERVTGGPE